MVNAQSVDNPKRKKSKIVGSGLDEQLHGMMIGRKTSFNKQTSEGLIQRLPSMDDTITPPEPNLESPVIYDHPDAKSLLDGKPAGTFLIHQDKNKNTDTKPYTIYTIKASKTTGKNRLYPTSINFNKETNTFNAGEKGEGKSYSTLDDLITANSHYLKHNVKFDQANYVDTQDIPGSKDYRPKNKKASGYVRCVENYKK